MLDRFRHLLTIAVAAAVWTGCPDEVNPPEPRPPGVRIKPYAGDTSLVDVGSHAVEGSTQAIRIAWHPLSGTVDNIIEEYIIFRSGYVPNTVDSPFVAIASHQIDGTESDSGFTDQSVVAEKLYRYLVVAKDSKRKLSDTSLYFDPSNQDDYILTFELGKKVSNLYSPTAFDTGITTKPQFTWCPPSAPIRYVVKLATISEQVIWIAYRQSFITDFDCSSFEYLTLHSTSYIGNGDSLFVSGDLSVSVSYRNDLFFQGTRLKKGTYLWRVDCEYGPNHTSRSRWQDFTATRD